MLDTIDTVLIGAAIAALLTATIGARTRPLWSRVAAAATAGAWLGLIAALTAGGYTNDLAVFGAVFATSLILASFVWRDVTSRTIVALNTLRVLGVMFLLLAYAGELGGPFPYFAGIGDIITGVVALHLALRMRDDGSHDARLLAWNAFGIADLVVAIALGATSANGSILQLIHSGAGSAAISRLPWSLIPLLLVPVFLTGHITIIARAASVRRAVAA